MIQMFSYPQGEGGHSGCLGEREPERVRRFAHVCSLPLPPLLCRFALRSTRLQTAVSMGGTIYGD
ncbi:hypothetical protein QE396_004730 [Enterobacter sp. SORGH_AS 287]|jgi:hypothetical protein|nr:hypothetical protein [Enterobacter sp. SORGH_AS_0287]